LKFRKRPLGTKLVDFKHVHQFVEITASNVDKNQQLLAIIRHLMVHHSRFPDFKMIVYVCKDLINELMQIIAEALGPLLPLAVMEDGMSVDKQTAFVRSNFLKGVLLVTNLKVPLQGESLIGSL
jgi:hypothetical protein